MNSLRLSSIIIAKNEADNIERCIKSQLDCIDDIVVLIDNSTTDNTLEIVKSFEGVIYEEVKWRGYSKTKKYALSKTKHDWVFWIDADEAITTELVEELVEFKKIQPKANAYSVARRAYFLNKWIRHSGWYPNRVTRLFNKNYTRFSDNDVHEHLIVEGKVEKLKNDLDHFTDPNFHHYFDKFNKYTSLAAGEMADKNRKAKYSDLLFRPVFIFLKMYILKRGFLDGIHGLMLALLSSSYVFTKYSKLWELNNFHK
ncbi:glycosyltransferase family 2 protein [Bacteroidota bacterium]